MPYDPNRKEPWLKGGENGTNKFIKKASEIDFDTSSESNQKTEISHALKQPRYDPNRKEPWLKGGENGTNEFIKKASEIDFDK